MARKLGLLTASLLVALVLSELALRLVTPFPIHGNRANRREHPVLPYVMDPDSAGIDENGFRNVEGKTRVDLVTLGDSHTFGFNVRAAESWPALTALETGATFYNYGIGGFGPFEYRWLFDHALEREPRTIIVGLYLANDLSDYCKASEAERWRPLREELALPSCRLAGAPEPGRRRSAVHQPPLPGSNVWTTRLAIASAIRHLTDQGRAISDREARIEATIGAARSSLSLAKLARHREFTDRANPAIETAFTANRRLLLEMATTARRRGADLSVLFIPSQENVLLDRLDPSHPGLAVAATAVEQERSLEAALRRDLEAKAIRTASPLECLQATEEPRLYPRVADGHPLAAGQRCYAEAAADLMRARGDEPAAGSAATEHRVFVLAGQSNMVGRGRSKELAAELRELPAQARLHVGFEDEGFGPEIGFVQGLTQALPAVRLTLIKHAMGGSSLLAWSPTWSLEQARITRNERHGPLYRGLLDTLELAGGSELPAPDAILWMQGERDARFEDAARDYGSNLEQLIYAMRKDLAAPDALFLIGEINPPAGRYPFAQEVRSAQRATAARLDGVLLVSTEGLTRTSDGVHYDSGGLLELGRRFAAVYLAERESARPEAASP